MVNVNTLRLVADARRFHKLEMRRQRKFNALFLLVIPSRVDGEGPHTRAQLTQKSGGDVVTRICVERESGPA